MLECYRVVLFQRRPNFYPGSSFSKIHSDEVPYSGENSKYQHLFATICALATSNPPDDTLQMTSDSTHTLTALLTYSWHAIPTGPTSASSRNLWTPPYFELALNRWVHAYKDQTTESTMLLFHLGSLILHTNMPSLHCAVHNALKTPKASSQTPKPPQPWRTSNDRKIAVMHANEVIVIARRILCSRRSTTSSTSTPNSSFVGHGPNVFELRPEPPHAAICVYLAVLVQWNSRNACLSKEVSSKGVLESGSYILSEFSVRIAQVLSITLRQILEKEYWK